jgi:hypothetical protein
MARGVQRQPLWQFGHCFASNLSGVTRNILLHWMQTRWITGCAGSPGFCPAGGWEWVSVVMREFYHDRAKRPRVSREARKAGRSFNAPTGTPAGAGASGILKGKKCILL